MSDTRNLDTNFGCPLQGCPRQDETHVKDIRTSIRVALFFDGTANNRTNVEHRLKNTTTYQKIKGKLSITTGSYFNHYSNVSKLEQLIENGQQADHFIKQYIEGIGTIDGDTDNFVGLTFGTKKTGVKGKVIKGIRKIIECIIDLEIDTTTTIETIYLDAFGFSRGAAAARYFIYAALKKEKTQLKTKLEKRGYTVLNVQVKIVGLFDTVASFGVAHYNDTRDLYLDSVTEAEKVIQLAAADEHRKNFRLTDIKSAVDMKKGRQIFLPGVHSDIGGGYIDDADEKDDPKGSLDPSENGLPILDYQTFRPDDTRIRNDKQWLLESGWYKKEDISEEHYIVSDPTSYVYQLKVTRSGIKNTYSRIPLHIMVDFASELGLEFKRLDSKEAIPKDKPLQDIKKLIDGQIKKNDFSVDYWWNDTSDLMKELRYKYFHFSANYQIMGIANGPQFKNKKRKRIIQKG